MASNPIDLIIGSLIWGGGRPGRGFDNSATALKDPKHARIAIYQIQVAVMGSNGGTGAAYQTMFEKGVLLAGIGAAFAIKILHFMGFQQAGLNPLPLIYDRYVAAALAHMSDAPYLPLPDDTRTDHYVAYCDWAEQYARAGIQNRSSLSTRNGYWATD